MAARKNLLHADLTRLRIKSSMLLNALQDHALGKRKMLPTQIKAAEVLLKKTTPDLSSVKHTGDAQNPVAVTIVTGVPRCSSPPATKQENSSLPSI